MSNVFDEVYQNVGDKQNLLPNEEGFDNENWGYMLNVDE